MKKFMYPLMLITFFTFSTPLFSQDKWTVDQAHSKIGFIVTHLVIAEVEGSFNNYAGTITTSKDDFSDAVIDFSVDVNSINTDNEMRDNHLKGDDFFNAGKFPEMTFKSTSFKKVSGNIYSLEGDLTIRDVTKNVKFDVMYGGSIQDPYGNTKAGFKAKSTINRFDYNLKWNAVTEAGSAVVSQDVEIILKLEFTKGK
ncbi:MAG: YceI family protein [Bacteroidales bacterium]|nr:YceI family protein [Bacteroidales bacterium]